VQWRDSSLESTITSDVYSCLLKGGVVIKYSHLVTVLVRCIILFDFPVCFQSAMGGCLDNPTHYDKMAILAHRKFRDLLGHCGMPQYLDDDRVLSAFIIQRG